MPQTTFQTATVPKDYHAIAPDGSEVRVLLRLADDVSVATFRLHQGQVAKAVVSRTVNEIWYVFGGVGEMWRKLGEREETVTLFPGQCISIPVGTHFQFRALSEEPLNVLGVTEPGWPLDEAKAAAEVVRVKDHWPTTFVEAAAAQLPTSEAGATQRTRA